MSRQPFKSAGGIRSTRKLELVHSDVCGPMQTESLVAENTLLHLLTIFHGAVQYIF